VSAAAEIYAPALHVLQAVCDDSRLYVPAAHCKQVLFHAGCAVYVPAGQIEHWEMPVPVLNVPAGHDRQASRVAEPTAGLNLPCSHNMHAIVIADEAPTIVLYVPAMHKSQDLFLPISELKEPAWHAEQAADMLDEPVVMP